MEKLPTTAWVHVLHFCGDTSLVATAHALREAGSPCLAELLAQSGVAAYVLSQTPAPISPSLRDAFAAAQLFPDDACLGEHFASRHSVVVAYLRATRARPSLSDFATWLFDQPALDSLIRTGRDVPRMLSFGLVRTAGLQPGWAVSTATMEGSVARDLLRILQGMMRSLMPNFPYLWIHISRAKIPRRRFTYPRDSFLISLPDGQSYRMSANAIAEPGLCKLGTMVSFTCPTGPNEVPMESKILLKDAGFSIRAN